MGVRGLPYEYGGKGKRMMHQTIGDRIKFSLNIRGMQQKELAKKLNVTEVTISRYVNNERIPRADTIIEMCIIFGVSADWMLGMV